MTPSEMEKRIVALEKQLSDLKNGYSIDLDTQRAFEARGFPRIKIQTAAPAGYQRIVPLSGSAENITILDYPVRWARIESEVNAYIPIYVVEE